MAILWLLLAIAGATAIDPLFGNMGDTNQMKGTEGSHARDAIVAEIDHGVEFIALVEGGNAQAATEPLKSAVSDMRAVEGVKEVSDPQVSPDGTTIAVFVTLAKAESQQKPFQAATGRLEQAVAQISGAKVTYGGGDLIGEQANAQVEEDLNNAEMLSLPITLIVLLFVFGGIVAAGLPVATAIATMLGAFGLLLGFSTVVDLDANVITVVTLLGLGLSIDYGLLLVARYREELLNTDDRAEAVRRAWSTAGRTISFSALTVAAALTGLLAFDIPRLKAMAFAGISTAIIAMLVALTLTAAMVKLLGKWIKPSKKELAAKAERGSGVPTAAELEAGRFAKLAGFTQRFPVLVIIGTLAVLAAISLPLLHVNIKVPQLEGLPRSIEAVQVADTVTAKFGQTQQAAVRVVARTDKATLDSYAAKWSSDPSVLRVEKAGSISAGLSTVTFAVHGDGQGQQAQDLVERLRADRPSGVESWVTGDAATLMDLNDRLRSGLPLAVIITVLVMIVLLFLMTGSLIIPIKAVIMNVVTLAATFGVLVAVFQDGVLAGPLDMLNVGGLSPYMIVIVFAFAFGLSMDYEVFLLGRIKEYRDSGVDSNTAVRWGLQRSGRIITSAAALMLIVFAFFAAAKVGQLEQIGLGLFIAVLVDATIVRCVLVPATLALLGRAAWWAPGPLKRLHDRFGLHESAPVAHQDAAEPESDPQLVGSR
ncbi:putative membrane protein [Catellatospora methionotrophica]|uniref:Putative membrane protein n=1 Tax=Catellatospora methionotrophica TaxID=121620 RepID=A0A8J3PK69_9ACTN|nr:MMPL family transporter [Catellatospora methionotrophica]GIG19248.1 putative membrane protein [Catellatospora methionotrophica]